MPGFPPDELTDQVACASATPLRIAENCTVAPAATLVSVGLMEKPCATEMVTTAVLEVTVVVLLVEVVLVCWATAVIFTVPLLVLGTTVGAV